MLFSVILAIVFHKTRSAWIKFFEFLIYLPMSMPPVAVGYGLLVLLSPSSLVGSWLERSLGVHIAFSFYGAVLASFLVSLGIGLRAMLVALQHIDEHHGHIAELLGARKIQVFIHITLPLCFPALLSGAILVFLRSLGEFGATIILAGNSLGSTRTLALAIWTEMQTPEHESVALLLVIMSSLIALGALVCAELLLKISPKNIK
jgi:molybdate transport system permease protein